MTHLANTADPQLSMALTNAEAAVEEALNAYRAAKSKLEIEIARYAAVRDLALDRSWGGTAAIFGPLPESLAKPIPVGEGRFRFVGMKAGDAALEVIDDEPLATGKLISRLAQCGWGLPDYPDMRAVVASISRLANVERTDDGWRRKPSPVAEDVDDLPFE